MARRTHGGTAEARFGKLGASRGAAERVARKEEEKRRERREKDRGSSGLAAKGPTSVGRTLSRNRGPPAEGER